MIVPDGIGTLGVGGLALEAPHGASWLFLGMFAAIVFGPVVAQTFRLPGMIGLLLGGLAIGPHGLGIVTATDTTVWSLGQLGLLYLMFSSGLELDLALFRRYRTVAISFGLVTWAVPLALGILAGRLLGYSVPAALLLGSIWASHTLVTYPIARAAGLASNRAVATAVAATVITDVLSLLILAAVSSSETGDESTLMVLASLAVGLAVLVAYCALVLPKATSWFFTGPGQDRPARYAYLLVATLSAAVLAEVLGIEGIVGAFLAGLALNRQVPTGSPLMERVEFFGAAVFVPVFLVSVGTIIQPGVMIEAETLALAAVFAGVVVGGKALAALLARPLFGFSAAECGLMFGLTLSQAAATLAATFIGYNIGLFGERVVNAVLVVILVTLVVSALATERWTAKVKPTPLGERSLGSRVVSVIVNEDRLAPLARLSKCLARPDGGVVTPLRVSDGGPGQIDRDRELVELAEQACAAVGLDVDPRLRVTANPVQAVLSSLVEEDGTSVILDWQMATRYQPALVGSRDDELLERAQVPVLLAAMSDVTAERVVLMVEPHCFDPESWPALGLALDVAERLSNDGMTTAVSYGTGRSRAEGSSAKRWLQREWADFWSVDRLAHIRSRADGRTRGNGGTRRDDGQTLTVAPTPSVPEDLNKRLTALGAGIPSNGPDEEGDEDDSPTDESTPHDVVRQKVVLRAGDLVVVPAHPEWEAFGPAAMRASATPGTSVVLVADPAGWSDHEVAQRGLGVLIGRPTSTIHWT